MATSNDDEITHIPAAGDVGVSDVNMLKRLWVGSTHDYNEQDSKLSELSTWFKTYIGTRGNAGDESQGTGNTKISLGRFRDNYIYGFEAKGTPETYNERYQNNNNGIVYFNGINGLKSSTTYTFKLNGIYKTQAIGAPNVIFTDLNGKTDNPAIEGSWSMPGPSDNFKDYAASVYHRDTGDEISFTIRVGYAGNPCRLIYYGTSGNIISDINDNISYTQPYLVGVVLINFKKPANDIPAVPENLTATAISNSQIDVEWPPIGGATSYDITRNGTVIASPAVSYYRDSGLTPSTTYTYKARAKNSLGNSVYSDPVSATTLALDTQFTLLWRGTDNDFNTDTGYVEDAIIFDDYTDYTYTFNVRLTGENGFTRTGTYVSRKYNTTSLNDTINLTVWPATNTGTVSGLISSIDITTLVVKSRDTGATVGTYTINRRFIFTPVNGVDTLFTDLIPGQNSTIRFEFVSLEFAEDETQPPKGIYSSSITFKLGLGLSSALREDWSISARNGVTNVDEGSPITFDTFAYNPLGTYFWKLNAVGTNGIESADFPALSGQLTTPNANTGKSSFSVTPTADSSSEGTESFNVTIHKGSAAGALMATSGTITVGDTSANTLNFKLDVYRDVGNAGFGSGGFIRVSIKRDSVLRYGTDGKCNVSVSFANSAMTTETNWNTTLSITQDQLLNEIPNRSSGIVFYDDSGYYNITGVLPAPSTAGWQETNGCIPSRSTTTVTLKDNLAGTTKSGSVGTHSNGLTGQAYPFYF